MSTGVPLTLPVTVIGGYLGAGKTTLINHLLRTASGMRLAVLVKEFGALSIDEDLIEAEQDDIISIAGGCICCSFGDDLSAALMDICAFKPPPDHILIEASGVAIPAAIDTSLTVLPGVQSRGIVVLVDAETVKTAFEDIYIGDTVQRQLAEADLLIVNKIDLIEGPERTSLEHWLTQKAPQARQVPARHAKVPLDVILGGVARKRPADVADHAVTLFDSFVFRPKAGTDAVLLAQALASQMYGVIRAKGFICNQNGRYTLLQVVGSRWQLAAVPEGSAPIVTARSPVLACEVGWIRMGSCVCTVRGLWQFRLISASG